MLLFPKRGRDGKESVFTQERPKHIASAGKNYISKDSRVLGSRCPFKPPAINLIA
jgi:hypothetical protein